MVQKKAAVLEHGLAELAIVEVVAELLGATAIILSPLASPDKTRGWVNFGFSIISSSSYSTYTSLPHAHFLVMLSLSSQLSL